MVRRKLNRNLKKADSNANNNQKGNGDSSTSPPSDTAPSSSPPPPPLPPPPPPPSARVARKSGLMILREKYRRVLLIILAWCTVQMYTDTLTVQWNRHIRSMVMTKDNNNNNNNNQLVTPDKTSVTTATTTKDGTPWTTTLQNWFGTVGSSRTTNSISAKKHGKRVPGQLRFDYANLQPKSPVAKILQAQRQDCSLPLKYHYFGAGGLGAELHAYSYSMCWSHKFKWRLYSTHNMYYDQQACSSLNSTISQMNCYFGNLELTCAGDELVAKQQLDSNPDIGGSNPHRLDYWNIWQDKQHDNICESLAQTTGVADNIEMRSQVMEAMFTAGISPVLLKEAQRQHKLVFGSSGFVPPPEELITVHIRWGDKKSEMELVSIADYIDSIRKIVQHRNLERVYIYLATEDPAAVQAFQQAMDPSWHLYLDQFYKDMLPFRNNQTQEVAGVARDEGRGNVGLLALGSLLVALEANHYVLTSASNWSRLINELRRSIVKHNGCNNNNAPEEGEDDCTTVVDLRKADFWMDLNVDGGGV